MKLGLLGLFLSISLNQGFAATIMGGSQEGSVPSAFAFMVFLNNEAAVPASLTFADSNQSATISVGNLTGFDAFTFNVIGAVAGDNFSLSAAGASDSIDISGVAFQTAAVPEPPTAVLLTASFALIGLVYRVTYNGDVAWRLPGSCRPQHGEGSRPRDPL